MSDPLPIGHRRLHFATIDSSNTHAASFANDPANHGLIVTADRQTAGRGQYQRVWQAPPGSGILMSVLLFPPPQLFRPVLLTAWAAVSVCRAIRDATGSEPTLKWPNDVLIGGRKVCGILCEAGTRHLVAGIGLNVNQTADDFRRMELPFATSLATQTNGNLDVAPLTNTLIESLDAAYEQLLRGSLADFEADWAGRFNLVSREVTIEKMDGATMVGQLRELAFDGVVVEAGEQIVSLPPEIIRHITAI